MVYFKINKNFYSIKVEQGKKCIITDEANEDNRFIMEMDELQDLEISIEQPYVITKNLTVEQKILDMRIDRLAEGNVILEFDVGGQTFKSFSLALPLQDFCRDIFLLSLETGEVTLNTSLPSITSALEKWYEEQNLLIMKGNCVVINHKIEKLVGFGYFEKEHIVLFSHTSLARLEHLVLCTSQEAVDVTLTLANSLETGLEQYSIQPIEYKSGFFLSDDIKTALQTFDFSRLDLQEAICDAVHLEKPQKKASVLDNFFDI